MARGHLCNHSMVMMGRGRLFQWISSWRAHWRYKRTQARERGNDTRTVKAWLRNTTVSCCLYAVGDAFEQRVEGYGDKGANDWSRTRRMATIGAFIGTIDTFWYSKLDEVLPGTDMHSVFKKTLLDQLIWSPICCTSFFYGEYSNTVPLSLCCICIRVISCVFVYSTGMSRMEGSTSNEALNEVKLKFWPTYKVRMYYDLWYKGVKCSLLRVIDLHAFSRRQHPSLSENSHTLPMIRCSYM